MLFFEDIKKGRPTLTIATSKTYLPQVKKM